MDRRKSKKTGMVPVGKLEKIERRCRQLSEALDRIARPVWWMQEDQKRATGSIGGLNGTMAASLAESPGYLQEIAKKALLEDQTSAQSSSD